MSEIEEELMVLESEILTLNLDGVLELAHNMKLEESSIQDKSRFVVSKLIREAIEERVSSISDKEESIEYLESIKAFLGPPPLEEKEKDHSEEPESNEEVSPEEREVLELQEEINKLMSKQKEIKSKLVDAQKKKNK